MVFSHIFIFLLYPSHLTEKLAETLKKMIFTNKQSEDHSFACWKTQHISFSDTPIKIHTLGFLRTFHPDFPSFTSLINQFISSNSHSFLQVKASSNSCMSLIHLQLKLSVCLKFLLKTGLVVCQTEVNKLIFKTKMDQFFFSKQKKTGLKF